MTAIRLRTLFTSIAAVLLTTTLLAAAASADRYAIFKSVDQGQSWSRSDNGLPGNSRINVFGALGETLFAGTDSGIFVSGDEANTWNPAPGVTGSSGRVISFAAHGQNVYAGTDRHRMLISADLGQSWRLSTDVPFKKALSLFSHEAKLYIGTDTEGVFVSSDGALTWTRMGAGLPTNSQVFALSAVNGHVFAGLYSKGLHRWNEQEHRWTKAGSVSPLALTTIGNTLVAGHNPGGIYWSDDMGSSWSKGSGISLDPFVSALPPEQFGELSAEAPVWALASNEELVIAGASNGIYYSEDLARTWVRARTGLPAKSPGVSFLFWRNLVLAGTLVDEATGADR